MNKRQPDIEDIQECAEEIVDLINTVRTRYDGEVRGELDALLSYANIILEKSPKICKLRDFRGYQFAVVGDDGAVRNATHDEAMRLIMGYKRGNALDILREWIVIDGQWVKRPSTNPDGSPVVSTR